MLPSPVGLCVSAAAPVAAVRVPSQQRSETACADASRTPPSNGFSVVPHGGSIARRCGYAVVTARAGYRNVWFRADSRSDALQSVVQGELAGMAQAMTLSSMLSVFGLNKTGVAFLYILFAVFLLFTIIVFIWSMRERRFHSALESTRASLFVSFRLCLVMLRRACHVAEKAKISLRFRQPTSDADEPHVHCTHRVPCMPRAPRDAVRISFSSPPFS
jgi:hypothetical protein